MVHLDLTEKKQPKAKRKPNANAVFEYLAGVWGSYLKHVDLTCPATV